MKLKLKNKAILLRKQGLSYSEIQNSIPVSKSTLSLWLRSVNLTSKQKQRLKKKQKASQPLGVKANKEKRINRTKTIINNAKKDIPLLSTNDLLLIGAVLYWTEGTKQKIHNPSERVTFSNSDPKMIQVYLKWLLKCTEVKRPDIVFSIYSHENIKHKEKKVIRYWSIVTGFSEAKFDKIYYKKNKKKKYRKNQGNNYYGLLRISVKRSTDLNRKISGWIKGICDRCGMV